MGMNEADTRAKLIDPALYACGWTEDTILREVTAGAIEIVDGKPRRRAYGRVDYTLRLKVIPNGQPLTLAVIEAKAEDLMPDHGLEQAKAYASSKRLNVPFVFSSNGKQFVEFDRTTGLTSPVRLLCDFPTPDALRARYEAWQGFSLDSAAARPLLTRYQKGDASRRYYQDAAIRAALEKIARGENRVLLALATGSGKTHIAVNLLKRISDAGQLTKALFLCDRVELSNQGLRAFHNAFGTDAAPVFRNSDNKNNAKNALIHIATYQTLDVDTDEADANFLTTFYPEDYFSHIIIDECHRSAWGKWSQVLTRSPNAVQIGLTATPRQIILSEKTKEAENDAKINADNLKHFGEPVYEYDMAQGIEDGYLAACQIIQRNIFLEEQEKTELETGVTQSDLNGKTLVDAHTGEIMTAAETREKYEAGSFEARLLLPERVAVMCSDLFEHLKATGGVKQKTIIFCASDAHADSAATALNNLYAEWCNVNGENRVDNYAFKCTAKSNGGEYLADLRGSNHDFFIATTVDLLTTGVDVPCVRNIVFFKYVKSPISFYQMVGRGTRLDPTTNKLMFRVYDYTNATRLFGAEFLTKAKPETEPKEPKEETAKERIVVVQGFDVHITDAGQYIVTMVDGKAMPVTVEEYRERLAEKLVEAAPTLDAFRERWLQPTDRRELLAGLPDSGRSPMLLQTLTQMEDYDLYDVLADIGYGVAPRTRANRADAFVYKQKGWLDAKPPKTAETLKALVRQFQQGGTDGLETPTVFTVPMVRNAGGIQALKMGGEPNALLQEAKARVFAV